MDAQIKKLGDNKIVIAGTLSFVTVPKAKKISYHLLRGLEKPVIDMQHAVVEDASVIALLLDLVKFSNKLGQTIQFINLSSQLLSMIKLSGLEHMLPIITSLRSASLKVRRTTPGQE